MEPAGNDRSALSVCTFITPTEYAPTRPESLPAARIWYFLPLSEADPATVEHHHLLFEANAEQPGVFEEEVSLLREEEGKPREVDHFLIGFHLREVGPDRDCPLEVRREVVEDVSPALNRGSDVVGR